MNWVAARSIKNMQRFQHEESGLLDAFAGCCKKGKQ
jgi:hypothetical protein